MISLNSQSSSADLEGFIREVRQNPGQDLRLPLQIARGGAFSFSAIAIQAIASWAALHNGTRTLQLTPAFATDEVTRDRFAGTLLGMAGLYFAEKVKCADAVLSRSKALEAVIPRATAMNEYRYRDTTRGRSAALCCFTGARAEFLRPLYAISARGTSEYSTIRSNSEFKTVLSDLLQASSSKAAKGISDKQLEVLGNLVHQLFKNSDVHTETDAKGNIYKDGIRGIQVREVSVSDPATFNDFVAGDIPLRAYLTRLSQRALILNGTKGQKLAKLGARDGLTFIEITVFDTGPGLALRWLSNKGQASEYSQMTLNEEIDGVFECFQLHSSTHTSSMRGDGLDIAVKAMKELKAFMYLRTGRLGLYQDFSGKVKTNFSPRHRYGSKKLLGEVVGVTYSICFPLI